MAKLSAEDTQLVAIPRAVGFGAVDECEPGVGGPSFNRADGGVMDPLAGHDQVMEPVHGRAPAGSADHVLIDEDPPRCQALGGAGDHACLGRGRDVVHDIDDGDGVERPIGPRGLDGQMAKIEFGDGCGRDGDPAGDLDGGGGGIEADAGGDEPHVGEEMEPEPAATADVEDAGASWHMGDQQFERTYVGAVVLEQAERKRAAGVEAAESRGQVGGGVGGGHGE